jgi:hypothetical protein
MFNSNIGFEFGKSADIESIRPQRWSDAPIAECVCKTELSAFFNPVAHSVVFDDPHGFDQPLLRCIGPEP